MRKHPRQIPPPPIPEAPAVLGMTQHAMESIREVQIELAERRIEAVRLYKPMPKQDEFHACMASERLVIGGNRSGKSACTFMEDARAATGQDPYGKYPATDGNLVIIGKNWTHIGMVVVPMLFRAGAFKMIRDEATKQWRAFVPGPDDHRKSEAKPAPPLIPPRLIKDMAWVQKNAGYLNKAELTNGWTITCFSSEGEPPQGFQADLVHIDEDINNESWVGEMQARLADRKGRFVWSAMPHSKNDALLGLCERADKAEEDGVKDPIIRKFTLRFLDNAHIDTDEKKKNIERWSALGMDELRMRAEGEFTTESTLMYPTFNTSVHGYPRSELPGGIVPPDWTRYVAIDPGHAVMACLFGAVPPDEKFLLLYDELYIRQCNALIFGEQFEAKAREQHFYNFIMDMHGGMLRDLGSGRLPHELYSEELKKRGVRSQVSGFGFTPGSDDIPARTALVRQMLHIRGDGTTKLKVLEGACPNLLREIKRYRKKTSSVNGQIYVTDEPQTRGDVHAVQTMEYMCAYEPKYHQPPKTWGKDPWWVKYLADKRRRQQSSEDNCVILGPTGNLRK
jgi:Terminase large subunit, T4likevirus-type, N-terminal